MKNYIVSVSVALLLWGAPAEARKCTKEPFYWSSVSKSLLVSFTSEDLARPYVARVKLIGLDESRLKRESSINSNPDSLGYSIWRALPILSMSYELEVVEPIRGFAEGERILIPLTLACGSGVGNGNIIVLPGDEFLVSLEQPDGPFSHDGAEYPSGVALDKLLKRDRTEALRTVDQIVEEWYWKLKLRNAQ